MPRTPGSPVAGDPSRPGTPETGRHGFRHWRGRRDAARRLSSMGLQHSWITDCKPRFAGSGRLPVTDGRLDPKDAGAPLSGTVSEALGSFSGRQLGRSPGSFRTCAPPGHFPNPWEATLRAVAERGLTLAVECDLPNWRKNFILPLLGTLAAPSAVRQCGSEPCRQRVRIVFPRYFGESKSSRRSSAMRRSCRRLEIAAGSWLSYFSSMVNFELLGERGHRVERPLTVHVRGCCEMKSVSGTGRPLLGSRDTAAQVQHPVPCPVRRGSIAGTPVFFRMADDEDVRGMVATLLGIAIGQARVSPKNKRRRQTAGPAGSNWKRGHRILDAEGGCLSSLRSVRALSR